MGFLTTILESEETPLNKEECQGYQHGQLVTARVATYPCTTWQAVDVRNEVQDAVQRMKELRAASSELCRQRVQETERWSGRHVSEPQAVKSCALVDYGDNDDRVWYQSRPFAAPNPRASLLDPGFASVFLAVHDCFRNPARFVCTRFPGFRSRRSTLRTCKICLICLYISRRGSSSFETLIPIVCHR
jgi:hypothetical protein